MLNEVTLALWNSYRAENQSHLHPPQYARFDATPE